MKRQLLLTTISFLLFSSTQVNSTEFVLCIGAYDPGHGNNRCYPKGDVYRWCGTHPLDVANELCSQAGFPPGNHSTILMNTTRGNKCGYSTFRLICSP